VIARRGVRGDAASPPGRGPIMFTLHKNGVIFRYKIAREGRRDGWCSPLPSRRAAFGRASFSQGSPILACLAIVLGHQAAQFAAWKSRKTARQCTLVLLSYRRDAPSRASSPMHAPPLLLLRLISVHQCGNLFSPTLSIRPVVVIPADAYLASFALIDDDKCVTIKSTHGVSVHGNSPPQIMARLASSDTCHGPQNQQCPYPSRTAAAA